jgi:phosphate butyryltransferase
MNPPDIIENRTFDEIAIGDSASLSRTLGEEEIKLFALASGDVNPAHLDPEYAASDMFHHVIAHGLWGGGLISAVLGTELPGPGTIYLSQSLRFTRPVGLGDTITATVTVTGKDVQRHLVDFDCRCANQRGEQVIGGEARVKAPTEKVRRPRVPLPDIRMADHGGYRRLLDAARGGEPVVTAVAHPCSAAAIEAVTAAAREGLIAPVLIGPEAKIRAAAVAVGADISSFRLVPAPHSHAAAARAVELVRAGEARMLMKGSLSTEELMAEVVPQATGLRTERRISHVYVMDVPGRAAPLLITDAAINITPGLDEKADIIRNAIDLAHVLGIERPKVAILSAVETINPAIASTLEAAALCKMAQRGQIVGGDLDGPLAFDSAISEAAARTKDITSPIAGKAEIVVVPNLEAGSLLAKQLTFLGGADAAGIVLGARVPIILSGRAESLRSQLASCAVAALLARNATKAAPGMPSREG